jgi:pyridoxamine 5'-phosphate oxidase
MDLKNLRLNYGKNKIDFNNLESNPIIFFKSWFEVASKNTNSEANACVLSTITKLNTPDSRVVLLKDITNNGFVFFTNFNSSKSLDIINNNDVSLNFYWPEIERQVRINGTVTKINRKESVEYFQSRPRESQLGAWLSEQSSSINFDHSFDSELNIIEDKFKDKDIECPLYWGGYCVKPLKFEFWQGRPSRLHDRLLYEFESNSWKLKRLAP